MTSETTELSDDRLWFKDAVIYELHVRAFHDSDADGVGDFRGLTEKLDYLADLGVTAIWLLPFYPSPLRDDGYDIADYTNVHPSYGNMRQFRRFLEEAHKRGLRVITELVINHTSDQHPWFKRAVRAKPGSSHRDFYVWSGDPDRWSETRIIFQDTEHSNWAWHHEAESYYWHRFFSHQPDLNYDNPEVLEAVKDVLDFWVDTGVDGMRLDAIPYLIERDGTNNENLPETHDLLKALRKHLDQYPNRMFLAEANQWPEDAAAYFGDGDECHMNFHFPLMPRLFMAVRMEDRFPVIDILQQTPEIPENCQWAVFLRNHDELTLEMVTDEERDYMYRAYAHDRRMRINVGIRRRLAPLLGNDRRLIELLNGLLFSMPGTPVIYYGDEIGMGDNIYLGDRDGVRTPMQWSADRNAGFSRANPQRLYLPAIIDPEYHYETVNVEAQQNNPSSLLWFMKRLIGLRKRHKVFGRGSIRFLYPENPKVLAFVRELETEDQQDEADRVLVVANLSRFTQAVELDLSSWRGATPVELFGRTPLPPVEDRPYFLTLGPYQFHWFALDMHHEELTLTFRGQGHDGGLPDLDELPVLTTRGAWTRLFTGRLAQSVERALPEILAHRRWFGGKARTVQRVDVMETLDLSSPDADEADAWQLVLLRVDYAEGEPETYVLPLAFAQGTVAEQLREEHPAAVLAHVRAGDVADGVLIDGMWVPGFASRLFELLAGQERIETADGELVATTTPAFVADEEDAGMAPSVLRAEQSNTSVVFGSRYILKLFRRAEAGENPDLEIGRFLTDHAEFPNVPKVAGNLSLTRERGEPVTVAVLQDYVQNEGDAWGYTLDAIGRYAERALTRDREAKPLAVPRGTLLDLAQRPIPDDAHDEIGLYLGQAELLGRRTAELHLALASDDTLPAFAPEAFSQHYQRSLYQSMRTLSRRTFAVLRRKLDALDGPDRDAAQDLLTREEEVLERFRRVVGERLDAQRIRIHGDYHLGQVLVTGSDFVVIDFEGEPARPLSERRLKRSPLRDVAGMLRSFHYAAHAGRLEQEQLGVDPGTEAAEILITATELWHRWVSAAFLREYLTTAAAGSFLPSEHEDLRALLDAYLLEKAIYELGYELNNRPDWVPIPMEGVRSLLDTP